MRRKPKPAQTRYRPRRAEAFDLCDAVNGGHCSCRKNFTGPCQALWMTLMHCHSTGQNPVAYEKARIMDGRRI